jgi:UDP-N-acetylmuramyl pentapeptide synthase
MNIAEAKRQHAANFKRCDSIAKAKNEQVLAFDGCDSIAETKAQHAADFKSCDSIRDVLALGKPKAEAKPFQEWATRDVLPSIRKTGSYSLTESALSMAS